MLHRFRSSLIAAAVVASVAVVAPVYSQVEPAEVGPFAEAKSSGEPVELADAATSTDTVFANPDGTYTREMSNVPFRVQTKSGWKDIDRTLDFADDGTVKPKVLDAEVLLSAGGESPLITSVTSGVSTSISWDGELPRPELDGSTATYPEVLNGVDLRVTVTDTGTTTVLVVKDAAAAANPALRRIEMPVEVDGGRLVQDESGALHVEDEFGKTVAESSQPVMWDSSGVVVDDQDRVVEQDGPAEVDARTLGPSQGDVITEIPSTVSADSIVLKPDPSALVGDGVQYPVFVDPTVGRDSKARAMVHHNYPTTSFYNWSADSEGVGYQSFEPWSRKRLFYRFSTSAFSGAEVTKAEFKAIRKHSASCSTATINLYEIRSFKSSTTWNNQPSWSSSRFQDDVKDSRGFTGCTPGNEWLEWNATKGMKAIADDGLAEAEFGLRNDNESNQNHWRRFGQTAKLSVTYSFKPGTPVGLGHEAPTRDCTMSKPIGPDVPILVASLSDRDSSNGETVRAEWQLFAGGIDGDGTPLWSWNSPYKAPTSPYKTSTTFSLNLLKVNGKFKAQTYSWRVRGKDSSGQVGPWAICRFVIDPNAPLPPHMTLADNSPWVFGGPTRPITLSKNPLETSDPRIALYRWSMNNTEPTHALTAGAAPNYTASMMLGSSRVGYNVFRIWAEDVAGNRSDPFEYKFDAAWSGLASDIKYDFTRGVNTGKIANVGTPPSSTLDLTPAPTSWFSRGFVGSVEDFAGAYNGTTTSKTSTRALNTDNHLTVAAWLAVSNASTAQYAVSHDGNGDRSAFRLGVEPNCLIEGITFANCFAFGVYDVASSSYVTARAPFQAGDPTQFTYVAGVYNAAENIAQIWLYDLEAHGGWYRGSASSFAPAAAVSAPLVVGGARQAGALFGGWKGMIDDVYLTQGLTDQATLEQLRGENDKQHESACFGTECE